MEKLSNQKCIPCEVGGEPLNADEIAQFLSQLEGKWVVKDNHSLERQFKFKNFVETMKFVNKVADLAESEGHHPDLHIFYNKLTIELWTHAVGGLSVNDFIVATKINNIWQLS